MDERAWLARYAAWGLLVIGGLEWFLGRTASRVAAAPNLEGFGRSAVEVLGRIGIFALSPAFLLAALLVMLAVLDLGSRSARYNDLAGLALAFYLPTFVVFTAIYALVPAELWLNITFNILSAVAIWSLALKFVLNGQKELPQKLGVLLAALSWSGWYFYVLEQETSSPNLQVGDLPTAVLSVGELAAVLTPIAFFVATALPHKEWRHVRRWIAPIVLALLFAGGSIADATANTGFTGVFATWSVGLNLIFPWPLYSLSLALYAYAILTCFSYDEHKATLANPNVGLGLVLLFFAGYNLQLPYQHLIALLSLLLFTGLARPMAEEARFDEGSEQPLVVERDVEAEVRLKVTQ